MAHKTSAAARFLSTPSARRATCTMRIPTPSMYNFYPRPPRGGRLRVGAHAAHIVDFYPRPPRGGRLPGADSAGGDSVFLSTPSARRATSREQRVTLSFAISIHALREEGDKEARNKCLKWQRFLSTPSARRATTETGEMYGASPFLSTPSARRATFSPEVC